MGSRFFQLCGGVAACRKIAPNCLKPGQLTSSTQRHKQDRGTWDMNSGGIEFISLGLVGEECGLERMDGYWIDLISLGLVISRLATKVGYKPKSCS